MVMNICSNCWMTMKNNYSYVTSVNYLKTGSISSHRKFSATCMTSASLSLALQLYG